ncbi:O-antigen ligase family protein [Sulfurovum sp.]|uniref:O-antigen ligase family protein n=1 Tax=Sulfurovum sp. TaxID=1969726 RepID=UPI003562A274
MLFLLFPFSLLLTKENRIYMIRNTYIVASVIISLWAIFNHLAGITTHANTAGISATTNIWGMLLVLPNLSLKKIWQQKLYWLSMSIFLIHNFMDQRRTPFIILFVGLFLYDFLLCNVRPLHMIKKKRFNVVRFIGLILVLVIVAFSFADSKRLNETSIRRGFEQRQLIFLMAWMDFEESPLVGKGFGYVSDVPFVHELGKLEPEIRIHNVYVNILRQGGIIGLTLYLAIIFFLGKQCWSAIKKSNNALEHRIMCSFLVCLVAYLMFGMTSARAERPEVLVLLVLIAAITQFVIKKNSRLIPKISTQVF